MENEFTALEFSVAAMFGAFETNKGQDGKLSKQQFLNLLKQELPHLGGGSNGDDIFDSVDVNQDGSVEFKEFALMVAKYASASYGVLQELSKHASEKA